MCMCVSACECTYKEGSVSRSSETNYLPKFPFYVLKIALAWGTSVTSTVFLEEALKK